MTRAASSDEARTTSGGKALSIIAMVFGLVAVFFVPIVFGPLGIVIAAIAALRHEPWWVWGAGVAAVGMVVGMVLGYLVVSGGIRI